MPGMDLISQVTLLGGASDRRTLVQRCGTAEVDRALSDGVLVTVGRGRYALASANQAVHRAAAVAGILGYRSAAQRHGWGQRLVPALPDVIVPRTRRVPRQLRSVITPHWIDLAPHEFEAMVTTKQRTLVDCLRMLPVADSLPIADSALRLDDITPPDLLEMAEALQGRGRRRAIEVAGMASAAAANAFESVLRAIAESVPGLQVHPQYPVSLGPRLVRHPDLADPVLRILIEAESFEWHGEAAAMSRDCARYNAFTLRGWLVLRFSWRQVMRQPAYVRWVLRTAVRDRVKHANVSGG